VGGGAGGGGEGGGGGMVTKSGRAFRVWRFGWNRKSQKKVTDGECGERYMNGVWGGGKLNVAGLVYTLRGIAHLVLLQCGGGL